MFLNGHRLGKNVDPYTPFTFEARGLRPGRENRLVVVVDSLEDPRLPEELVELGRHRAARPPDPGRAPYLGDLGTMSQVTLQRARHRLRASCSWTACCGAAR